MIPPINTSQTNRYPNSQSTRFVAIGDWGSGLPAEYQVAQAMTEQAKRTPFNFVITLGDNFYPKKDSTNLLQTQFLQPFNPFLSSQPIPWFPSLGNHDMPVANAVQQVFKMPGSFYTYQQGPIQFFVLNTNNFNRQQAAWLESELQKSSPQWKIVYGHHPAYTSGSHGSNPRLIQNLVPILEKNKVDLYLNGHEHGYERLKKMNGVQYITSGGGGGIISQKIFTHNLPMSQVRASQHHFLVIDADPEKLTLNAITPQLKLLDTVVLEKKNSATPVGHFQPQTA